MLAERVGLESEARASWGLKVPTAMKPAASGCWGLKPTTVKIEKKLEIFRGENKVLPFLIT